MMFAVYGAVLWQHFSVGNMFLVFLLWLVVNQLLELYELRGMPPGPRLYSIPFVGSLFSLVTKGHNFRDNILRLRAVYGRVFYLKLGGWKAVYVSGPEAVKEVLVTKSADFAARPGFWSVSVWTLGGKNMIMGNGSSWRLHRKLFVTTLRRYLGNQRFVEETISEQTKAMLQYMIEKNESTFNPNDIFMRSVANVICSVTFGDGYSVDHPEISRLLDTDAKYIKGVELNRNIMILNFFPMAKYFPFKAYREITDLAKTKFSCLRNLLDEQKKKFSPSKPINSLASGLLAARLQEEYQNDDEHEILLSDDYLMNTINDMFLAGFETTSTSLLWAIAFLVNYPQYQQKAQEELDSVVGRQRFPLLDDRPNLPIVNAIIMEVLRLGNILFDALPHMAARDTSILGYRVPKDTVVFANLESIHLDPKCWQEPHEFNPFRHIDAEGKLNTNQGNWLPFSAGRRACAGESLAKIELFLFLSALLQRFSFVPKEGEPAPSLVGVKGAATKTPLPYKVVAIERKQKVHNSVM